MATVDRPRLDQGSTFTPDSLPMGTNVLPWGQAAARHLLPDRGTINSVLETLGYKQGKVIDVVGGLLERIHQEPIAKDANVWRYRAPGSDTGMEARIYGAPDAVVVTTTPHRTKNWEMADSQRSVDQLAAAEYSSLFGQGQQPPYRFKMVLYDPGEADDEGAYDPARLAKASQIDRELPKFGMQPQDWGWKGLLARWAILYQTSSDAGKDVQISLNHGNGSQSSEIYKIIQAEPGKVHVAARVVNRPQVGF